MNAEAMRVAVVIDEALPHAQAGRELAQACRTQGWSVEVMDARQAGTAITPERFDTLILPAAANMPIRSADPIHRFMQAGGNMVLLGGQPYENPTHDNHLNGQSVEQILSKRLAAPALRIIDDFSTDKLKGWNRDSRYEQAKVETRIATLQGNKRGMRLTLPSFWGGWELQHRKFEPVQGGADLVRFELINHAEPAMLVVELMEPDGHRFSYPLQVARGRQQVLLSFKQFTPFQFGKGAANDPSRRPDPAKVHRFSIGMSQANARHHKRRYDFTLGPIELAKDPYPPDVAPNPFQNPREDLFPFDDKPHQYRFDGEYQLAIVGPWASQPDISPATSTLPRLPVKGWSALATETAPRNAFDPLLAVVDEHGRKVAWALSVFQHRNQKNKHFVLFSGVEDEAFLADPSVQKVIMQALSRLADGRYQPSTLPEEAPGVALPDHANAPAKPYGPLRIKNGRFIGPDGKPHALVGINYTGTTGIILQYMNDEFWDERYVEQDFALSAAYGINAMRLYLGAGIKKNPQHGQAVLRFAEKYGIHVMPHLGAYGNVMSKPTDVREAALDAASVARAFGSHDAVFGYDIQNEPYLTMLAGLSFNGEPSPILKLRAADRYPQHLDEKQLENQVRTRPEWPLAPKWLDDDAARQVYAFEQVWRKATSHLTYDFESYSTLPGLEKPIAFEGEFADLFRAADQTLGMWIDAVSEEVRKVAPGKPITVGYNRDPIALPCNQRLDFMAHHVYELPYRFELAMRNITTLDRMAQTWPGKPNLLGEFGITDGLTVGDVFMPADHTAILDSALYLKALIAGHDGALRWRLFDHPMPYAFTITPWTAGNPSKMVYEEGFGFFEYDGTYPGKPKPLAHFTRFLAQCRGSGAFRDMHIDIQLAELLATMTYVCKGPDALFVAADRSDSNGLRFDARQTTAQVAMVMIYRSNGALHVLSTADLSVELDLSVLLGGVALRESDSVDQILKLDLLAGKSNTLPLQP